MSYDATAFQNGVPRRVYIQLYILSSLFCFKVRKQLCSGTLGAGSDRPGRQGGNAAQLPPGGTCRQNTFYVRGRRYRDSAVPLPAGGLRNRDSEAPLPAGTPLTLDTPPPFRPPLGAGGPRWRGGRWTKPKWLRSPGRDIQGRSYKYDLPYNVPAFDSEPPWQPHKYNYIYLCILLY